jgi:hypothetical protein
MGQQKGNPTPSYQNQAYEALRPNTGARVNRDMGSKPVMIDDTTTLQTVISGNSNTVHIYTGSVQLGGNQSITGSLFINSVGNASNELSISSPGSPPFGNSGESFGNTSIIRSARNLSIETYGWNNGNDSGYHGYTMNSGSFYVNSGSLVVKGPDALVILPTHAAAPTSSLSNPWGFGVPNQPPSGSLYFNTTNFHFYGWTGAQWKQLDN